MEIPGWLYLLIGAIVAFASYYINTQEDSGRMILFLGLGILLMLIGMIKILFGTFKKTDKYIQPRKYNLGQKKGFKRSQVPGVKYCSNCGQLLRNSDSYCPKCGNMSPY